VLPLFFMFCTKNIVFDIDLIPSNWVFEYYLNLEEKLIGQRIRIKSLWNFSEKTPSMFLFVNKEKSEYYFKDFSTGEYGNKINLVQKLFNLTYSDAIFKILNDFKNQNIKINKTVLEKENNTFNIEDITFRNWNANDLKYWKQFNIDQTLLDYYQVKPIHILTFSKNYIIRISNDYMYAYCDDDVVYKIYQPLNKDYKFLKINNQIQGLNQLKYNSENLIICSSLKDAMCLKSFNYDLEVIAPESESTIIKPYIIENLKLKYKNIITLFDNDKAGEIFKNKYEKEYNIKGIILKLEKDISDSVKIHGTEYVNVFLKQIISEIFYTR
jgi:hypothetical protein